MSEASVLFSQVPMSNGKQLGVAQLNLPGSLNALNLDMVQLLTAKLTQWQADNSISGVFLWGSGDKAFCAGGDVVSLYNAMKASPGETPEEVATFFTQEYQLDYLIHTYNKPVVVWGSGFIMGGGIGLFAGASHKVVTETSRLAMPEITIGLFPDVGGSYFLNKVRDNLGLFLGLTGVQFNGADAKFLGMADYLIADSSPEQVFTALAEMEGDEDFNAGLDKVLLQLAESSDTQGINSNVEKYQDLIISAVSKPTPGEVIDAISLWKDHEDKWLSRAAKTMLRGSPITQRLVFEQLQRGRELPLADCFRMELGMACECAAVGEFAEGVRALLIEKDGAPTWLYKTHEEVPDELIEKIFTRIWQDQTHPLAALGE